MQLWKSTAPQPIPSCILSNVGCQGCGDAGWQEVMPWGEPSSSHHLVTVVHVRLSAWTLLFRGYIHICCWIFLSALPFTQGRAGMCWETEYISPGRVKGHLGIWDTGTPLGLNGFADVLSPCKTRDLVSIRESVNEPVVQKICIPLFFLFIDLLDNLEN